MCCGGKKWIFFPQIWVLAVVSIFCIFFFCWRFPVWICRLEKSDGVEHEFRVGDIHIAVAHPWDNFMLCSRAGGHKKTKAVENWTFTSSVEIRWEFLLHIWIIPLKLERAAYKKSLNMGIYYFYSYSIVAFSYSKAKFIELRFGSLHMVIDHSICDILLEKLFGLFGVIILRSGQLQVVTHFLSRNIIECLLDNLFVFYP